MKKIFYFLACFLLFFSPLAGYTSDEETLIIFDSSISMLSKFHGTPKYISAASAAKYVLDQLPPSKKIGLRIIGLTLDSSLLSIAKNPSDICKTTQLVVPIRPNNIGYIKNSLDTLMPLGTTPLTYTLDMAINYDFSRFATLKHIILITDGGESCNGDPCKFIKEISIKRNDIKIDVIAISVSGDDFLQLKCISDFTNGKIINISKLSDFQIAFNTFLSVDYSVSTISNNRIKNSKKQEVIYKNYLIETYK